MVKNVKIRANTLCTGFLLVTTYRAPSIVRNDNIKKGKGKLLKTPIIIPDNPKFVFLKRQFSRPRSQRVCLFHK